MNFLNKYNKPLSKINSNIEIIIKESINLEMVGNKTSRDKILQFLLVRGSDDGGARTVKDISDYLEISINATRQYLIILEKEGLVVRTQKKSTTGRPAILYSLHESALEKFPKTYLDFSLKLLSEIQNKLGNEETIELLQNVGKKIAEEVKPMMEEYMEKGGSIESLRDRLNSIIKIYEKYGKYPELLEDDDSFGLKNYNCLVFGVAKENPLVCNVDETIVSELAGVPCKKELCLRNGDDCCLYRIKKKHPKKKT